MNNQGLFDVICNAGSTEIYELHQDERIIIYESGCYVVLWDMRADKKIMIHPHDFNVTALAFCGMQNEYIISVDGNLKPSLYVTEWQSLTRVHQIYVPVIKRGKIVENYKIGTSKPNNLLVLAENYKDQYQISLWDLRLENLTLLLTSNDENQSNCMKIEMFDTQKHIQFATVEKFCIKFWKYQRKSLELINRIHVKDEIVDSQISPLTQFFIFVTKPGRLVIISQEGQYISSLTHPQLTYSCFNIYSDYMLIGSLEGEIEIYQLSSMKYVKNLKNIRQLVSERRRIPKIDKSDVQKNVYKYKKTEEDAQRGRYQFLTKLSIAKNSDLMALTYSDNNIFVYDFQKSKIIHSLIGHSNKIKEIVWSPISKKTFVSCGADGVIHVWNFLVDRWESYPIYPPATAYSTNTDGKDMNTQGNDLSFRKQIDKRYKITSIQVSWSTNEVFTGDNRGSVFVYDLITTQLKHYINLSTHKITEISISASFFGVCLANGNSYLYERSISTDTVIKLEAPSFELAPNTKFHRGIKLIEDENIMNVTPDKLSLNNTIILQSKFDDKSESGNGLTSEITTGMRSNKQRVITTNSVNTLRLHQVYKNKGNLTSIVITSYSVEGRILDFQLHPSNDYILILSSEGYVGVFKLANGEIRGKIKTQSHSTKICIDPSGLYLVVASPFMNKVINNTLLEVSLNNYASLERDSKTDAKKEILEKKVNPDQSILSLYEVGTGEYIGEVHKVQTITSFTFSDDGNYLAVGSQKGLLTVLSIEDNIKANIFEVLDGMIKNPFFWSDFQLDLDDGKEIPNEEPVQPEAEVANQMTDTAKQDKQNDFETFQAKPINIPFENNMEGSLVSVTEKEMQVSFNHMNRMPTANSPKKEDKLDSPKEAQVYLTKADKDTITYVPVDEKVTQTHTQRPKQGPYQGINLAIQTEKITETRFTNQSIQAPNLSSVRPEMVNVSQQVSNNRTPIPSDRSFVHKPVPMDNKSVQLTPHNIEHNVVDQYIESPRNYDHTRTIESNHRKDMRDILSDPDDIDDETEPSKRLETPKLYYYPQTQYGELNYPVFMKSQNNESNRNKTATFNEASQMYEDISEFEKKFYRNDSEEFSRNSEFDF